MLLMGKKSRLLMSLALVATLITGCSSTKPKVPDEPPEVLYQKARLKLDTGNYLNAIELLEALDSRYPFGAYSNQVQLDLIYAYYKHYGYQTEVMGASFHNVGEILALAGCDLLTISPDLLNQLQGMNEPVERKLIPGKAATAPIKLDTSEPAFRYALNNDAMATEKLAEGIRAFAVDAGKLESLISAAL